MDEAAARLVVLAQAIETTDTEGRLIDSHRRDEVDRLARHDAMRRGEAPLPADEFVALRAQRVLAEASVREPGLAALQDGGAWRPVLDWGLPMAALIVGVLTDVIGNPHRLDLVSLPLLGMLAWNLVVYLLIVMRLFLPRAYRTPLVARLGRLGQRASAWQRRKPSLRMRIAGQFHLMWLGATQALHGQRCLRLLHLSAAAWAAGVILSLLVRGLVVEYRVGWESTFLGPAQVHAILSVLRYPALLVLPFEPFTVLDIAALRFSDGGGAQGGGAPWVWMYVSLLLVLVIVPRLALATIAAWREAVLARNIPVGLDDPYHRRIVSLLDSTRVQLGLVTHRIEDRAVIHRLWVREPEALPVLASSGSGDVLRLVDVLVQPPPQVAEVRTGWWGRVRSAMGLGSPQPASADPLIEMRAACDVIVHVAGRPGDVDAARPIIEWFEKPVLFLRLQGVPHEAAPPGLQAESLDVEAFAPCWWCERAWLHAVRKLLPEAKSHGFDRVARSWDERNEERLHQSMLAVADHLLDAARQSEEVRSSALTVRSLLPAERQAQSDARQAAMDAIAARVRASSTSLFARLRHLHGVSEAEAEAMTAELAQGFRLRQSVDSRQAGLAGAATGAAMGASVDLLTGGLTLGAAAALGGLVGGAGAFIAAAWKNRTAPGGGTLVQLSDDMLMVLAQSAMLAYLVVTHARHGAPADVHAVWTEEAAQALDSRKELFAGFWNTARSQPNADRIAQPLAHELQQAARRVFKRLYGDGSAG